MKTTILTFSKVFQMVLLLFFISVPKLILCTTNEFKDISNNKQQSNHFKYHLFKRLGSPSITRTKTIVAAANQQEILNASFDMTTSKEPINRVKTVYKKILNSSFDMEPITRIKPVLAENQGILDTSFDIVNSKEIHKPNPFVFSPKNNAQRKTVSFDLKEDVNFKAPLVEKFKTSRLKRNYLNEDEFVIIFDSKHLGFRMIPGKHGGTFVASNEAKNYAKASAESKLDFDVKSTEFDVDNYVSPRLVPGSKVLEVNDEIVVHLPYPYVHRKIQNVLRKKFTGKDKSILLKIKFRKMPKECNDQTEEKQKGLESSRGTHLKKKLATLPAIRGPQEEQSSKILYHHHPSTANPENVSPRRKHLQRSNSPPMRSTLSDIMNASEGMDKLPNIGMGRLLEMRTENKQAIDKERIPIKPPIVFKNFI